MLYSILTTFDILVDSLTISKDSVDDVVSFNMEDKTLQVSKLQFRWDYILVYILLKFLQGGGVGELCSAVTKRFIFRGCS